MDGPWPLYLAIIGFMCGILYTLSSIYTVSKASANKDVVGAITTIVVVNGLMCLTLAGTGYFSVNSMQIFRRPYIFFILHASLIFAMIGFCVSILKQLGVNPIGLKPASSSSGSKPTAAALSDVSTAQRLGEAGFALGLISIIGIGYLMANGKFK
jgi:hypothetical protein